LCIIPRGNDEKLQGSVQTAQLADEAEAVSMRYFDVEDDDIRVGLRTAVAGVAGGASFATDHHLWM
jgi:hypothetical protein